VRVLAGCLLGQLAGGSGAQAAETTNNHTSQGQEDGQIEHLGEVSK
jgi:hypothetical protein